MVLLCIHFFIDGREVHWYFDQDGVIEDAKGCIQRVGTLPVDGLAEFCGVGVLLEEVEDGFDFAEVLAFEGGLGEEVEG